MAWTNPIPAQPGKQWLYINNTLSILGNSVEEDSLICFTYSQGYTGVILYQLNTMAAGGNTFVSPYASQLTAFIAKCAAQGLQVGGAFGGPNVIQAILALGGFKAAVSEIEWWNYSHNLPYQRQDATGTYSFYDSLNMFMTYKASLNAQGIDLLTYNGFTKPLDYAYQWKYPVLDENIDTIFNTNAGYGFRIQGNFTTDNASPIIESNVFQYNDIVKLFNYPSPGLDSYIKLTSVGNPTTLWSGNTQFECVQNQVSDGRPLITTGYQVQVSALSYYISGTKYYFNLAPGHGLLAGSRIACNFQSNPEFAFSFKNNSGGAWSSALDIAFVSGNLVNGFTDQNRTNFASYSASAGVVTLNFNPLAPSLTAFVPGATGAEYFRVNDTITVSGLPAGFNGSFVVTNVTVTSLEYSAAVSNTPTTTVTQGALGPTVVTVTRPTVTFGSPVTFAVYVINSTASQVSPINKPGVGNLHEIVYLGAPRFAGPGVAEIALRGDKTYHFGSGRVSKIAIENYNIPSPSNIFEVTGTAIYNAGLNQTRIFLTTDPTTYIGSGSQFPGYFTAMANLDVVYQSNSLYGSPGTELQQLITAVDGYALTVYEQNVPNYAYIKNRVLEIGTAADNLATISPKVYYLFGAYENVSRNFYLGLNSFGNNTASPAPKKGPKEAYDYMSFALPTGSTPNNPFQVGSPLYADLETNPLITDWVQIAGSLTFHSSHVRGYPIKNGPNMILGPTGPALNTVIIANPPVGTTPLAPLTFCDDCLPKTPIKSYSVTSNVVTIITGTSSTVNGYPHDLLSGASVVISGISGVYDGTYTITVTNPTTFTFALTTPDVPVTNAPSGATVTPQTQIQWTVTPPSGGIGSVVTPVTLTTNCSGSINYPNTLSYNGSGLYTITAVVYNSKSGSISELTNRIATGEITYTVFIDTGSEADPLNGGAVIDTQVTCSGGTNGAVQGYVDSPPNAGIPPYVYTLHTASPPTLGNQIATSGTTSSAVYTFSGLATGTYYILITDSIGQNKTYSVNLTAQDNCTLSLAASNPTCNGYNNGEIELSWSSNEDCGDLSTCPNITWTVDGVPNPLLDNLFLISGLPPGLYVATVIDCNGCTLQGSVTITDPAPTIITSVTNSGATCEQFNGILQVQFTHPCYIDGDVRWYSGQPGTPNPNYVNNIVGDGSTATVTTAFNHNLSPGQVINITGVDPVVYDSPIGCGLAPLTYIVLTTPTLDTFTVASPYTASYISGGTISTQVSQSLSCAPYPGSELLYLGSNTYTTTLGSVPAGDYYFTLLDECGCSKTSDAIYSISGTTPAVVSILNEPEGGFVLCAGDQTSVTIDANATSDCAFLTYGWYNLTTGQFSKGDPLDFSNLTVYYPGGPGQVGLSEGINTIQVQVIDCNGCATTLTTTVEVVVPHDPVTGLLLSGGPLTICPSSTQSYFIDVQGGFVPGPSTGTGEWYINGIPFPSITDYPTLEVTNDFFNGTIYLSSTPIEFAYVQTDLKGCTSTSKVTVDPPEPIILEITVTNIPCGGLSNSGAIDLRVINGCPPFSYSWTNLNDPGFSAFTQDLVNIPAGVYQCVVSDSAGNSVTSDPVIVTTVFPGIDNLNITSICNNGANGAVAFDVINVTLPYDYTWTSVQGGTTDSYTGVTNTALSFTNLKPGSYIFALEDANGCTYTTTLFVGDAPPVVIDSTVYIPSCFAACDGKIELSITGGVGAPYTIQWNHGPTTATIENLCKGIYGVTVTDSNGCFATAGFNVVGNYTDPLDFTEIVTNPNFQTGTLGSIQITSVTNGGGPPYTYVWTDEDGNILGTDPTLSNLGEGTYEVTITGYPGCYKSRKYTLQSRCDAFSYPEYRLQLYKFQCCAGQLAKKYVDLVEIGRTDLAKCLEMDLKYMTVALDTLTCISAFPDPCLSCDDLNTIFNQLKKICDCDCCQSDENAYTVRYDYETQTFIPVIPQASGGGVPPPPPPPPPPPDQLSLREDGGSELREDTGDALREN